MDQAPEALLQLLADEQNRPLADVRRASHEMGEELSTATSAAAENLLTKAVRRLAAGDPAAARAFVQRAVALPNDEPPEHQPAVWSAHMLLFVAIGTDMRLATADDADDSGWLDRAEQLMGMVTLTAAREIRICLASFVSDIYELSAPAREHVKRLTGDVALNTDALDGTPPVPEARVQAILDILDAVIKHQTLLTN